MYYILMFSSFPAVSRRTSPQVYQRSLSSTTLEPARALHSLPPVRRDPRDARDSRDARDARDARDSSAAHRSDVVETGVLVFCFFKGQTFIT